MSDAITPPATAGSADAVAAGVGAVLRRGKETILGRWCRRVLDDPEVPVANRLRNPHLRDDIPALIDRIVDRLMQGDVHGESDGRQLGRGHPARQHAHQRYQQGYSVAAALRELSLLRVVIADYCAAEHVALVGKPAQVINTAIDEVMSQVAAEIAEREQWEKARAVEVLERGLPVLVVDANWNIVFTNAGQEGISGTSRENTRGRNLWDVFPSMKSRDLEFGVQYHRAMDEKVPVHFEAYYSALKIWTEQNVYPTSEGGLAIFFNEITDRKRDERSRLLLMEVSGLLSESLDYQTTLHTFAGLLVQHLADYCMIDLVEEDGRFNRLEIAAADPQKLQLMRCAEHYPPSSAPGSPFQQVLTSRRPMLVRRVTPEWLDELADHPTYRRILGELAPTSVMLVPLVVRDHSIGVLKLLSTNPTRGYDERDLEFALDLGRRAAFAIDNARLHRQVRTDAENLAKEAVLRERFMGILSHDIRSPLSAVLMTATMMLTDHSLPERLARGAERIVRSADRMNRMVRDLLDLTRVRHAGGIAITPESLDLASLVREVVDEVHITHEDREIEVEQDGMCTGSWDRDRISQVVNNLVMNAVTYSTPGTKVKIKLAAAGEGTVTFSVHNQGTPIPPEVIPTLFAAFNRPGSRAAGAGLGLGLFIAFEIVRAHRGTMEVRSNAEDGTTFTVTLPAAGAPVSRA